MAAELFEAGGIEGMVGGQWLDLEAEGGTLTLPELIAVHRGKTGALIQASCVLGALAARRRGRRAARACDAYGADIGLAFQIADDVLDVTGTSEELGKTAGQGRSARQVHVRPAAGHRRRARAEAERHAALGGRAPGPGATRRRAALGALARYIVTRRN